ncbi:GDSL-type esterase/lipase family protein [Parasediminibacterium paludis]|uniref:GDSL-type esterase/lipase family protein n=1 Tax=Parasediminibacterium paludis TaxID=908966 RepID=A0ABV8PZD8_9BACT
MKNRIKEPVIIVSSVTLILLVLSIIKLPNIKYLNNYRAVDILADLRVDTGKKSVPIVIDSLKTATTPKKLDTALIADYSADSLTSLLTFFNKLDQAKPKHKKVRIAYFGDSFIESDNITADLRTHLQTQFGGIGIGFLPIQSVVSAQYHSINFTTKGFWQDYHFKSNPYKLPLGFTGHIFYPLGSVTTAYMAKNKAPFYDIKLYTGLNTTNKAPTIFIAKDGKAATINVSNTELVNETYINAANAPVTDLRISASDNKLPVYGISIDNSEGVYIDNYAYRGNTSLLTNLITKETWQAFNKHLQYDLIILHYGLNAIEHDKERFPWFENSMNKLIQTIKQNLPNTPILLVSTSDFAYRYNGKYNTDKAVPFMVATQQRIANNNKVAFWDLYTAMGGENTIVQWAEDKPTLAYKDYTHVNERGAKKVADIFYSRLMASKKYYQQYAKK